MTAVETTGSRARAAADPRSVICVTDHLYRDLQVARDAVVGRFHHLGVTLDLGRRPDWLANQVGDIEWRTEWIKLYEGLHLAHAFVATGDWALLETWEDLVESFCDQVPVGLDPSDVSARRLQNWLYAWQTFAANPNYSRLRDGLAERLRSRIRADADHLASHLTKERNHRTLELYALLLVGIALEDRDRAVEALDLLAVNATTDIWADGVHRECSTDYHMIALRSWIGAIANARRAEIAVPPELVDRVHLACDFAVQVRRPDGVTPAVSDGDESDFTELFSLGAEVLDRPDLAWVTTTGRRGHAPRERLADFPVGGYYLQRSGWGERDRAYREERWALFDCGPIGDGGHGHYDQLSLLLAAGGHPLVVDPGRFTYEPESPWRQWFKGTAAHNTVCVDGLDQTPFRPGKPSGPRSDAQFLGRASAEGLDLLRGRADSPAYDAVHTRTVAFVDDDYWIVHDRLRSASPHSYEARWHLAPRAHGATDITNGSAWATVESPGCVLSVPADGGALTVESGWVSPTYGTKVPAPVVVLRGDGRDVDLLTVITPGHLPVEVSWSCAEDEVEVRVTRPGEHVDVVGWRNDAVGAQWKRLPW